jgi:hypothetical protein
MIRLGGHNHRVFREGMCVMKDVVRFFENLIIYLSNALLGSHVRINFDFQYFLRDLYVLFLSW